MITFKKISNAKDWEGVAWTIVNEEDLSQLIARVAVGQYNHVLKILKKTELDSFAPTLDARKGAINLLIASNPDEPYHRDGWLFQVIAWIAANIQDPSSLKTPPQMIHADKGCDGIHVQLDKTGKSVVSVVVCEEKATINARKKIRDEVWPDFEKIENGERSNNLVSEITTLLKINGDAKPEEAISKIFWKKAHAYRLSITIKENQNSKNERQKLFKGYNEVVPGGNVKRRRAETLCQKNIRRWLAEIANKVIAEIERMEPPCV